MLVGWRLQGGRRRPESPGGERSAMVGPRNVFTTYRLSKQPARNVPAFWADRGDPISLPRRPFRPPLAARV